MIDKCYILNIKILTVWHIEHMNLSCFIAFLCCQWILGFHVSIGWILHEAFYSMLFLFWCCDMHAVGQQSTVETLSITVAKQRINTEQWKPDVAHMCGDYIRWVLDWQLDLLDHNQLHTITVYTLHNSLLQLQLFSEDCCSVQILTRNWNCNSPLSRQLTRN
jgi:hypothetical protein